MIETASLELSRKLYEVSGWNNIDYIWYIDDLIDENELLDEPRRKPTVGHKSGRPGKIFTEIPAYDLGFLLRKLPATTKIIKASGTMPIYGAIFVEDGEEDKVESADTPEDALALLAIELFEQKIIKKEG